MPSYSSNVSRQDFFTLAKLELFLYYGACFEDWMFQIIHELSQPDCDPRDRKNLNQTFCDNITDFLEEIHYLTEECVLPVSESLSV